MNRSSSRRTAGLGLPAPVRALALLAVLTLVAAPGAWAPAHAGLPLAPTVHSPPTSAAARRSPAVQPSSVEGGSPSPAVLCLGCAGVTLGMGGGSVLGVVLFASTWPGLVAGCLSACALAW